jgi:hypothetical protein
MDGGKGRPSGTATGGAGAGSEVGGIGLGPLGEPEDCAGGQISGFSGVSGVSGGSSGGVAGCSTCVCVGIYGGRSGLLHVIQQVSPTQNHRNGSQRVNSRKRISPDIAISIDACAQPNRITLDVSSRDRIVIAEVVVTQACLGIVVLPRKAQIVV